MISPSKIEIVKRFVDGYCHAGMPRGQAIQDIRTYYECRLRNMYSEMGIANCREFIDAVHTLQNEEPL